MQNVSFEGVYFVEVHHPQAAMNPVAIRPTVEDDSISWEDTSRGIRIAVKNIELVEAGSGQPPLKIEIVDKNDLKITLHRLTKERFDQQVKNRVAGPLEFSSDEECEQYYLNTNFEY